MCRRQNPHLRVTRVAGRENALGFITRRSELARRRAASECERLTVQSIGQLPKARRGFGRQIDGAEHVRKLGGSVRELVGNSHDLVASRFERVSAVDIAGQLLERHPLEREHGAAELGGMDCMLHRLVAG
jgi:hypothetical protein